MEIKTKEAKNGLKIVCAKTPYLNKASIVVLLKGGSVYENKNNNGIFHLIEHSIFNGSKKYKNSEKIENKLSELGIIEDVRTYREFTKYSFSFHTKNSKKVLKFISKIILNPIFDEKQIEKEKKIIIEEIGLDDNDNYKNFYVKSDKLLFKKTPLIFDPAGTKISLNNLGVKILQQIYQQYYIANNMVIAYVGAVSPKKIFFEINKNFRFLKKGKEIKYPKFELKKNKNYKKNTIKITDNFNFLSLVFLISFSKKTNKDLIYLLKNIIDKKIRDNLIFKEKMGYDIGVNLTEFKKIGLLDINGALTKDNRDKILKILEKEIFSLKITETEFQQAKNKILNDFDFILDDSIELSEYLSFDLLDNKKLRTPEQRKIIFQKITLSSVQNFTKKILTRENSFLFIS